MNLNKPYDDKNFWIELSKQNTFTQNQILRHLTKTDLYFLCRYVLGWNFYEHRFARWLCALVQENPWRLWLVARGHLKSLTITCAHTIQCILNDPESSTCIFSYNNPTAKTFLIQIKQILETNNKLKNLFPDILYQNPQLQSPKWTENEGIVVKRKTNRKEPTVFSCGLVDSQRVGFHANYHKFDDVVIPASVSTAEMIAKTTAAWELSDNMGMMNEPTKKAYCGSRYHFLDTYKTIMERGVETVIIPATKDGKPDGKPVFMKQEDLDKKRQEQGLYTFSAQMLLNPISDMDKKFQREWIQYYDTLPKSLQLYLMCDPANTKRKKSDWTAMLVVGLDSSGNLYLIDGIHDKLSLGERYEAFLSLYDKHRPALAGYERYGIQADLEYFNIEARRTGRRLPYIYEMGGSLSKEDRILRLVPDLENKKVFFPRTMPRWCKFDSKMIDIVDVLTMEIDAFPMGQHDDLCDVLSRIYDLKPLFAKIEKTNEQESFEAYLKEKERAKKRLVFPNLKYNNKNKNPFWS